jgi:hypothetical protein
MSLSRPHASVRRSHDGSRLAARATFGVAWSIREILILDRSAFSQANA